MNEGSDYGRLCAPIEMSDLRLVPLRAAHEEALVRAFAEDELWTWMLVAKPANRAEVRAWLDEALARAAARAQVPWAIELPDGTLAGTTRFLDLRWHDRGLEIGWTMMLPPLAAAGRTAARNACCSNAPFLRVSRACN